MALVVLKKVLLKLLWTAVSEKILTFIILKGAKALAKSTETPHDDTVVKMIEEALKNEK